MLAPLLAGPYAFVDKQAVPNSSRGDIIFPRRYQRQLPEVHDPSDKQVAISRAMFDRMSP